MSLTDNVLALLEIPGEVTPTVGGSGGSSVVARGKLIKCLDACWEIGDGCSAAGDITLGPDGVVALCTVFSARTAGSFPAPSWLVTGFFPFPSLIEDLTELLRLSWPDADVCTPLECEELPWRF